MLQVSQDTTFMYATLYAVTVLEAKTHIFKFIFNRDHNYFLRNFYDYFLTKVWATTTDLKKDKNIL